jgi:hypothetical protein
MFLSVNDGLFSGRLLRLFLCGDLGGKFIAFLGKGPRFGRLAHLLQVSGQGGQVAEGARVVARRLAAIQQAAAQRRLLGLVALVHDERVEPERVGAMGTVREDFELLSTECGLRNVGPDRS